MPGKVLPGIGAYSTFVGTNPAANTEIAETVPAGHAWCIRSVSASLTQGATQTPQPLLTIDEGISSQNSLGTVTVTQASPAVFTRVAHGLNAGDIVFLKTTGALYTGLAANTVYYVIAAGLTSDAFEVSLTRAGSAVNTSVTQSGVHTLYRSAVLYEGFGCSAGMGVNTTCLFTWAPGLTLSAQVGATTNVHSTAPLHDDLILAAGARIGTVTVGIGANSDYAAPTILIYDMIPYV